MAGYGAHITITSSVRPSIFDVVSQDNLMSSLQPALKHILKVIGEKDPAKFSLLYGYNEEIFLLIHGLIQHHYLKNYGASFAENFYGLKRAKNELASNGAKLGLSKGAYRRSMMSLVCFHYMHNKFESLFLHLREEAADGKFESISFKRKIYFIFFKLWPYIHLIWEFATLIFYIRYIIGKSDVHSPLMFLCGLSLVKMTEDDYDIISQRIEAIPKFINIRSLNDCARWSLEKFGSTMMSCLEIGTFFLQFLNWFYSSNQTSSSLLSSPSIPKSPQTFITDLSGTSKSHCPICLKLRINDTVCTVSGYVFCYSCIIVFVQNKQMCPVTSYPASTSQLIKIYKTTN